MPSLPLLVFDVNETLLDLEVMSPLFQSIVRERFALREWFANLILYSEVLTLAQSYVPFTEIGAAVMRMIADTRGIHITEADKRALTDQFSTMPAHPEVPGALRRLPQVGFRLFTLTFAATPGQRVLGEWWRS
jgi:2-haloacid dehalogenase